MPHIKITGEIGSIVWDGKLVKVWEQYEFKGEMKHRIWNCWFDMPRTELNEGDTVTFNGELSTKIGTWTPKDATEPKNIVEHHLNDCTISNHTIKTSKTTTAAPVEDTELPF